MRTRTARTVLSVMASVAIVAGAAFQSVAGALSAQASSLPVIISEINYAGSQAGSADQWVELYNPNEASIDLVATPYTLATSAGVTLATLNTGSLVGKRFYLVSARNSGGSDTTLAATPDMVVPGLSIPTANLQLVLRDAAGTVVDRADDGLGLPLAGSSDPLARASMVRTGLNDGTQAGSWMTPASIGGGFQSRVGSTGNPVQFGSPANHAVESTPEQLGSQVSSATAISVTQAPGNIHRALITATFSGAGLVSGDAYSIDSQFVNQLTNAEQRFTQGVNGPATSFSYVTPDLSDGFYKVAIIVTNQRTGDRTVALGAVLSGSTETIYPVATSGLAAPALSYPAATNKLSATVTAAVASDITEVIVRKDGALSTLPVASGSVQIPVALELNKSTSITVYGRTSWGQLTQGSQATIVQDSIVPVLDATKLSVISAPAGTNDQVAGMAGASEPGATAMVYADAARTVLIGSKVLAADGSFAPISIGDNRYATVYVVVVDAAGNVSNAVMLSNSYAFTGVASVTISKITQTSAHMSVGAVAGAATYKYSYRVAGGTASAMIDLCTAPGACMLERDLVNLSPNTTYVVSVVAYDAAGATSQAIERSFTTLPTVTTVTATGSTGVGGSPAPVAVQPARQDQVPVSSGSASAGTGTTTVTEPAATVAPEPTAIPTASPEDGEVKSAQNEQAARNWTPWIILGILIALAILAITAYFYWFGGEGEGEAAAAGTIAAPTVTPPSEPAKTADKADKSKRW